MDTINPSDNVLQQAGGVAHQSSLLVMQPGDAKPPFFIIYPDICRDLVRYLGPDLPVYGLIGLELVGKRVLNRRIEDRAAYYLTVIRSIQPVGPYFLGGRCMGGLVAFEMAQQLWAQGQVVALLALFDTPAPRPYCYKNMNVATQNDLRAGPSVRLGRNEKRRDVLGPVKQKVTNWFWKMAFESYTGLESLLPPSLQDANIGRVDRQASRNYVPHVYPGRITYFWALETHEKFSDSRRWGWEQLAAGGLEFHEVPGGRKTMMREPQAQTLGAKLKACLHEAHMNEGGVARLKGHSR